MREIREISLPSSDEIVSETFRKLGYLSGQISVEQAKERFEEILNEVWRETLVVLEEYENRAYSSSIPLQLIQRKKNDFAESERIANTNGFKKGVIEIFHKWYPHLREMFLSIAQSRKARGGRDFELQFGNMLDLIQVPYQKVKRAYRVDFMIPDDATFNKNPTSAAIVSAKRTLRERWREVVEELYEMRSPNIFLVTADYNVSDGHVKAICADYRIHLVVWKEVKSKYTKTPLVMSYDQWSKERLPILRKFWES